MNSKRLRHFEPEGIEDARLSTGYGEAIQGNVVRLTASESPRRFAPRDDVGGSSGTHRALTPVAWPAEMAVQLLLAHLIRHRQRVPGRG